MSVMSISTITFFENRPAETYSRFLRFSNRFQKQASGAECNTLRGASKKGSDSSNTAKLNDDVLAMSTRALRVSPFSSAKNFHAAKRSTAYRTKKTPSPIKKTRYWAIKFLSKYFRLLTFQFNSLVFHFTS